METFSLNFGRIESNQQKSTPGGFDPMIAPLVTDLNASEPAATSSEPEYRYVPIRRTTSDADTSDAETTLTVDAAASSGPPVKIPITVKHGITLPPEEDEQFIESTAEPRDTGDETTPRDGGGLGLHTPGPREVVDDLVFGGDDAPEFLEVHEPVHVELAGPEEIRADAEGGIVHGTGSAEHFIGSLQSDIIFGNGGNDLIHGFAGEDMLFGGDGDDFLAGGIDVDELTGGAGRDVFFFNSPGIYLLPIGRDIIKDFEVGVDYFGFDDFLETEGNPTLADQLVAIQGDGGTRMFAETKKYGLFEFAFLEGVDAADIQPLIVDESILF